MSNALEAASLIMVPSGYENGTLASVKPNDGTGDFTFSRGSNLSATRVGPNGYIERGYENLLLQSNSFLTTWTQVSILLPTSGQAGYDGSTDAWYFEKTGAFGRLQQSISTSGVRTLSVYLKAKDSSWVSVEASGTNTSRQYFDLTNISKGSSNNIISSSIEDAGDGWRKCSITYEGTKTFVFIFIAEGNGQIAGTSGSLYIQDAMLNQGLVAYPYIETTTAPVAGGILEDMPRISYHDPSSENGLSDRGHILLEPSRTNLAINEYGFSVFSGASISSADVTNPFGDNTDVLEVSYSSFGGFRLNQNVQVNVGVTYCMGHFMKFNNSEITISASGAAGSTLSANGSFSFDGLGNPSKTGDVYFIKYPNGWYYVYGLTTGLLNGSTKVNWMSSAGSILVCKSQYETNSGGTSITYPTSYIPTYGVSQTRLQDSCNVSGLAQSFPFTAYIEIDVFSTSVYNQFQFRQDASNHVLRLGNTIRVGTAALSNTNTLGSNKFALSVDAFGNFELFKNSTSLGTGTITQIIDEIRSDAAGYEVKEIILFPTALSDEECIQLTTV